jgi:hypothetical protein
MLDDALQNLIRLLRTDTQSWNDGSEESFWRGCLEIVQAMPGGMRKQRSIARENDKEQLLDTLAELKYAVIFAEIGFVVEIEPTSGTGIGHANPDLRIVRRDLSTVVEVKRFRPARSGLQEIDLNTPGAVDELPLYGDPPRDWQRIFDEIERKFAQAGDDGVIAIWNNNDTLEADEIESAAAAHRRQSNQNLSFVLYKPDVVDKFSCYRLNAHLKPQFEELISELEQLVARDILLQSCLRSRNSGQNAG